MFFFLYLPYAEADKVANPNVLLSLCHHKCWASLLKFRPLLRTVSGSWYNVATIAVHLRVGLNKAVPPSLRIVFQIQRMGGGCTIVADEMLVVSHSSSIVYHAGERVGAPKEAWQSLSFHLPACLAMEPSSHHLRLYSRPSCYCNLHWLIGRGEWEGGGGAAHEAGML